MALQTALQNTAFRGFAPKTLLGNNIWSQINCPNDDPFWKMGEYAACLRPLATNTDVWTECVNNTRTAFNGQTDACPTDSTGCQTLLHHVYYPNNLETSTLTWFPCGKFEDDLSAPPPDGALIINSVGDTFTFTSAAPEITPFPSPSSGPSLSLAPSTSILPPAVQPIQTLNQASQSKAWITGVILGVIGFITTLAIIYWYLRRRQAKRRSQQPLRDESVIASYETRISWSATGPPMPYELDPNPPPTTHYQKPELPAFTEHLRIELHGESRKS